MVLVNEVDVPIPHREWTLESMREDREAARQHLLDLLRAPYTRMSPWAITKGCMYLDHPDKHPEAPQRGCPCGKRIDELRVEPAKKRMK